MAIQSVNASPSIPTIGSVGQAAAFALGADVLFTDQVQNATKRLYDSASDRLDMLQRRDALKEVLARLKTTPDGKNVILGDDVASGRMLEAQIQEVLGRDIATTELCPVVFTSYKNGQVVSQTAKQLPTVDEMNNLKDIPFDRIENGIEYRSITSGNEKMEVAVYRAETVLTAKATDVDIGALTVELDQLARQVDADVLRTHVMSEHLRESVDQNQKVQEGARQREATTAQKRLDDAINDNVLLHIRTREANEIKARQLQNAPARNPD